jgi:hypothetical protein
VADPGPDLKPMTRDDFRSGPDSVAGTADDVYLLPIAGALVYILGEQDQAVVTDAQGRFSFASVPTGDVKLVIDGTTAINSPAGYYFPQMVMDLTIKPGVANTVMGSMGTDAEEAANEAAQGVYLPRLLKSILHDVGATGVTHVSMDPAAAPDLTPQQQAHLSIDVRAGSLVDESGHPLPNPQIGVSVVPPELVKDMLPAGVLQHTLDITIQAPGAVAFTTPAALTFPNVFGAAPGTQLNFLSFDHTTGRLEIDGTATVSADGLSATTDPGMGITHVGWHGLTPPGAPPITPPPLCPATPAVPNSTTPTDPDHVLPLLSGDTPTPDELNAFSVAPPPYGYVREVSVSVDSELQQVFEDNTGFFGSIRNLFNGTIAVPVEGGSWTLSSHDGPVTFNWAGIADATLKANGLLDIDKFSIYGGRVEVDVTTRRSDGDTPHGLCPFSGEPAETTIDSFYIYRYLNPIYATRSIWQNWFSSTAVGADVLPFPDAIQMGPGQSSQVQNLVMHVSAGAAVTPSVLNGQAFSGSTTITFSPPSNQTYSETLELRPGVDLTLQGTGKQPQVIYLNQAGLVSMLTQIENNSLPPVTPSYTLSSDEMTAFSSATVATTTTIAGVTYTAGTVYVQDTAAAMLAEAAAYYTSAVGSGKSVDVETGSGGATAGEVANYESHQPGKPNVVGSTVGSYGSGLDNLANIQQIVDDASSLWNSVIDYLLPEAINTTQSGRTTIFVVSELNSFPQNLAGFENDTAVTIAHELGHTMSLVHITGGSPENQYPAGGGVSDVMSYNPGGPWAFQARISQLGGTPGSYQALQLGMNQQVTQSLVTDAVSYYIYSHKHNGSKVDPSTEDQSGGSDDAGAPVPIPGKHLLITASTAGLITTSEDFGTQTVGSSTEEQLTIENVGTDPVTITNATVTGSSDFTLVLPTGFAGQLAAGESVQVGITFTATLGAAHGTFTLTSDAMPVTLALTGAGTVAGPAAQVDVSNNNLGGAIIGQSVTDAGAIVISNEGSSPLTITDVSFVYGGTSFSVNGLPADLADNPITIAPNASYSLSVTYAASTTGLERGLIQLTTNDPLNPTIRVGVVGTGAFSDSVGNWGNNYVAIAFPRLGDIATIRVISDSSGHFSAFLPASTPYQISVFDPKSGLIAHGQGVTGPSGRSIDITSTLTFEASTAPDSNGDGLPDDIKFAIGASLTKADSNGDGIDDFTSIQEGLNPLANVSFPTGVVARLDLNTPVNDVAVAAAPTDETSRFAYLVSDRGLTIADVRRFDQPVVTGQVLLPEAALHVAVDASSQTAAVTGKSGSKLYLINVADPQHPVLLKTISAPGGTIGPVLAFGGLAYVGDGKALEAYDLASGDLVQTLTLLPSSPAGAAITGLAREDSFLYALDSTATLRVIDLSGGVMTPRGSVQVVPSGTARGTLFVGGGVAYIPVPFGVLGGLGGYATVDVRRPDMPTVISGPQVPLSTGEPSGAIAANGTGLALLLGSVPVGSRGLTVPVLDLLNAGDPTQTNAFLTRFALPGASGASAHTVAIFDGIAFVSDGDGGLVIVNYLAFDSQGQPPTVTITTDSGAVAQGRPFAVHARVTDDVQVSDVALLVNGQVVATAGSFPYNLSAVAPVQAGPFTVQVRATDTGGNTALSAPLKLLVAADGAVLQLVSTNLLDGDSKPSSFRQIQLAFNKPIAPATLSAANFQVVDALGDVVPVQLSSSGDAQSLSLSFAKLTPGKYSLVIHASNVTDLNGLPLGAADLVRHFTILQYSITFTGAHSPDWSDTYNWDLRRLPTPDDDVRILTGQVFSFIPVSLGTVQITSLNSNARLRVDTSLIVTGDMQVDGNVATGAPLTVAGNLNVNGFLVIGGVDDAHGNLPTSADLTVEGTLAVAGDLFTNNHTIHHATIIEAASLHSSTYEVLHLDGVTLDCDANAVFAGQLIIATNGLTINGTASNYSIVVRGGLTINGTLIGGAISSSSHTGLEMEGGPLVLNGRVQDYTVIAVMETDILGGGTFSGTTSFQYGGDNDIGAGIFNGTMTLGPGITVRGRMYLEASDGATLINQGRILLDQRWPPGNLLAGSQFDMFYSTPSTGGTLGRFINQGTLEVGNGALLTVFTPWAADFPLSAQPDFINQGSLHVEDGGLLVIQGEGQWTSSVTTVDAGGRILIESPLVTATGSVSVFSGKGQWMAYNDQYHFRTSLDGGVAFGELRGGTVVLAAGAVLRGNPWFTGVTVDGDLEETQDFFLQDDGTIISGVNDSEFARFPFIVSNVTGGLTLNGTLTLGSADGVIGGVLAFVSGPQTLGGNAVIRFGPSTHNALGTLKIPAGYLGWSSGSPTTTLTLAPSVTLTGPAVYIGSVEDLPYPPFLDTSFRMRSNFDPGSVINHATITAPSINIDGAFASAGAASWSNPDGTIVNPGATVILDGNYGTDDVLSVQAAGGNITLQGRLQNTGNTLALNPATAYTLRGTVVGGSIVTPAGFSLPADGAELDGVDLVGDLSVAAAGAKPSTSLGLTVEGTLRLGLTGGLNANDFGTPGTPGYSGGYTQTAAGNLAVTLGRAGSVLTAGQLVVTSLAALDGTLAVTLDPAYVPQEGDSFTIVTFGSRAGQFAAVTGLSIGHGLAIQVNYNAHSVTLVVVKDTTTPS